MKLSKTQLLKREKLRVHLDRILGPLLKTGLPFLRNAVKPLAKSVLVSFGLTAAAPATDAAVHKKNVWIWHAFFGLRKSNNFNNF